VKDLDGPRVDVVSWRWQAARVVEELFPATGPGEWDRLLELRQQLLDGREWAVVVDCFLRCRQRLEKDHYLPLYRLRRLLEGHLRLVTRGSQAEAADEAKTAVWALWRHRGLDDLRRRAQHERYERDPSIATPAGVRVEVIERAL
jgi:hypothetical protein